MSQRGVVGVAAALDEARLQPGRGHGPADGRPAAVDHHRPHADRLHEDDVQQQVPQRVASSITLPPSLMTVILSAELANPVQGFDQDVGFLDGFFQRFTPTVGSKAGKQQFPGGNPHTGKTPYCKPSREAMSTPLGDRPDRIRRSS